MNPKRIGVASMYGDAPTILNRIEELEEKKIPVSWLSTGGVRLDGLTLFAAAAARTSNIMMGTCITPTFPRHPMATVQQIQVIASLAPGRFRIGLGPRGKEGVENMLGLKFSSPFGHLQEYVRIVKGLLHDRTIDYEGEHYQVHARLNEKVHDDIADAMSEVGVMISALRPKSYEFAGAEADGAISWVSPYEYLRDVALPAMKAGAQRAGRDTPPLIAHAPVVVHEDRAEVKAAVRSYLKPYPTRPNYQAMFVEAGYPEAAETGTWSDRMIDSQVISGTETQVADRIQELFDWGIDELICDIQPAGEDPKVSWNRTIDLLADVAARQA